MNVGVNAGGMTTFNLKSEFPQVQRIPNARKDRLLGNNPNQNVLDSGTGAKIGSNTNMAFESIDLSDEKARALLLPQYAPKNDNDFR